MTEKSELLKNIESATTAPVATDLGMLHQPDSLTNYGPTLVDGGASQVYSAARDILQTFNNTLTRMNEANALVRAPHAGARQEIRDGGGATQYGVNPELHDDFVKSLDSGLSRAGQVLDKNRAVIADSLNAMETEIAAKLRDPAANTVSRSQEASEVRQHIKSLKKEDRMGAVSALINEQDHVSVAAIINAPPLTVGLDRKQLSILRSLAETKLLPDQVARRAAALAVLDHVDRAAADVAKRYKALYPKTNPKSVQSVAHALEKLRT